MTVTDILDAILTSVIDVDFLSSVKISVSFLAAFASASNTITSCGTVFQCPVNLYWNNSCFEDVSSLLDIPDSVSIVGVFPSKHMYVDC